ncbi:MAG: hypothetical protein JW765_11205 [Deltaproteobacteria bacterium]|nr:hypothetical protein [Candidatus Zymogenaceae bacterium]
MARLMIGMILALWFVLSVVGAAVFRPPLSPTLVLVFGVVLLLPGIMLIVSGRRRVALFKKVGGAVIAAARKTGWIAIEDIARETETRPDEVRLVVDILIKRGVMPRNTNVS